MTSAIDPLQAVVARACAGDAAAVEELVLAVQDQLYGLAVRMLWDPEDARDATQEILIKIITHLGSYRGESRFTSWCFAVAANYLRTARRSRVEAAGYTFETFEAELHEPSASDESIRTDPEYAMAVEEIRIGCTLGMLTCLSREDRLAYIIGEILELDHQEAAAILEISPAAFRQRLSRARRAIVEFTGRVCGIVDSQNACRCSKRVAFALSAGRVTLGRSLFGRPSVNADEVQREIQRLDGLRRTVALYRTHPPFAAPHGLSESIRQLLNVPATRPRHLPR